MPTTTISTCGDAVFLSLSNALNSFLAAIPLVIGALIIIVIGWIIAGVFARVVTELLRRAGADRLFVLPAWRSEVHVRVDESRREHERTRTVRLERGDHAVRDGDAQRLVHALRRREHAAREGRGRAAAVACDEGHATPTRSGASTGATVRTS